MLAKYANDLLKEVKNKLDLPEDYEVEFETPKDTNHGDLSTNLALKLSKKYKKQPRILAQEIIDSINYDESQIEKIDLAGPGFINIKFSKAFFASLLKDLLEKAEKIGRSEIGKGKKVNVEYVSCNPTGLLHLGHGRNASLGDSVANFYEWLGYDVTREYYFNNAGKQMDNLANSIYARYMQIIEGESYLFPENGYHGEYIKEIAEEIYKKFEDKFKSGSKDELNELKKYGEQWCFDKIKITLDKLGVHQDVFYNETSLYDEGKVDDVIKIFKETGLAYEKDDAVWLKLSEMGLEDDRVIVKSTGEPTYRLPDIAYHREKFNRGFDIIVDVFGSDHIATIPDVQAAVKALDFDTSKIKVILHQFVTLMDKGKQVKMSKRTGRSYTLDDLLDEVGPDVARFFFIMRSSNTHLEFDLGLAQEQSDKNPVFYLQYAHARVCSIFANAKDKGIEINTEANLNLIEHDSEITLIKELVRFEETVQRAAEKCEPQILSDYLRVVASSFHTFYHNCRIIGVEDNLMQARFKLAEVTRNVLKNGLTILGISAPESM